MTAMFLRRVVSCAILLIFLGTAATAQGASNYLLGPGDVLEITVLDEGDLTRTVTIRPDGKVAYPLVGEIEAVGLTVDQFTERLTTALRRFLKHPQVSVSVTKARALLVYVVGQVNSPGSYGWVPGWTVMEAIAEAGGVTTKAALKRASIIRHNSDGAIPLDLHALLVRGDRTANAGVQPGDVILIPELLNRVLVLGTVKTPGPYDLQEGSRVLDALAAAGGAGPKAALTSVGLIRQGPTGHAPAAIINVSAMMKGDLSGNVVTQHADVIYVPARPVTFSDLVQWAAGITVILSVLGF